MAQSRVHVLSFRCCEWSHFLHRAQPPPGRWLSRHDLGLWLLIQWKEKPCRWLGDRCLSLRTPICSQFVLLVFELDAVSISRAGVQAGSFKAYEKAGICKRVLTLPGRGEEDTSSVLRSSGSGFGWRWGAGVNAGEPLVVQAQEAESTLQLEWKRAVSLETQRHPCVCVWGCTESAELQRLGVGMEAFLTTKVSVSLVGGHF